MWRLLVVLLDTTDIGVLATVQLLIQSTVRHLHAVGGTLFRHTCSITAASFHLSR